MVGLRVRNPHDLRHAYATILLMAHQSPAYVQKQLGHSSIKTTVDIYGHWISGEGRGGLDDALVCSSQITEKLAAQTSGRGRAVFLFEHNENTSRFIFHTSVF